MSDLEKPHIEDSGLDNTELGLNVANQTIAGLPIPKPVVQNALKAFGRLCSAAIEVPAAYLEGAAAEKRAVTEARVKLIKKNATLIARDMEVDKEYAQVAVRKFGQKIVREQVNLDLICEEAANQLKNTDNAQTIEEVGQIDDDWLNHFEKEASQRSTEDMQILYGKILAGEIRRPSSFSIKAVKIMGDLDSEVANLFRRLCSLCIVFAMPRTGKIVDARVLSLSGDAAQNSLRKYGLDFGQLNILHEYGLIISDYNSWREWLLVDKGTEDVLECLHQDTYWDLLPSDNKKDRKVRLHGVALSKVGQELFEIVEIEPVENYTDDLVGFFAKQNLNMVQMPKKQKA